MTLEKPIKSDPAKYRNARRARAEPVPAVPLTLAICLLSAIGTVLQFRHS